MIKAITILLTILMVTTLTACGESGTADTAPRAGTAGSQTQQERQQESNPGESQTTDEPKDIQHTIGEGVTVNYTVTSEDAVWEITGCPSYGDRRTPYVYGMLTEGDPFEYEIITIIIVNGNYYGKKPFNNAPNGFIKADGTFMVQFSSNDGVGTDWNAENIFLFLIPGGYEDGIEPDASAGYVIPPSQISELKENSVCVIQIDREIRVP